MELTIIVAIIAFLVVTLVLVGLLLFAKAKLTSSGEVTIDINGGEKVITTESGSTLLATLANNKVFLPSACGGGGSCGMCKCQVLEGGGVRLAFDGSDCGFLVKGEIEGFELAGSDGVFRPAKAVRRRPDPTVLYVSNYDVGSPVYLRYNFKNCSVGRLWDAFGQPVVPFRTDNF